MSGGVTMSHHTWRRTVVAAAEQVARNARGDMVDVMILHQTQNYAQNQIMRLLLNADFKCHTRTPQQQEPCPANSDRYSDR